MMLFPLSIAQWGWAVWIAGVIAMAVLPAVLYSAAERATVEDESEASRVQNDVYIATRLQSRHNVSGINDAIFSSISTSMDMFYERLNRSSARDGYLTVMDSLAWNNVSGAILPSRIWNVSLINPFFRDLIAQPLLVSADPSPTSTCKATTDVRSGACGDPFVSFLLLLDSPNSGNIPRRSVGCMQSRCTFLDTGNASSASGGYLGFASPLSPKSFDVSTNIEWRGNTSGANRMSELMQSLLSSVSLADGWSVWSPQSEDTTVREVVKAAASIMMTESERATSLLLASLDNADDVFLVRTTVLDNATTGFAFVRSSLVTYAWFQGSCVSKPVWRPSQWLFVPLSSLAAGGRSIHVPTNTCSKQNFVFCVCGEERCTTSRDIGGWSSSACEGAVASTSSALSYSFLVSATVTMSNDNQRGWPLLLLLEDPTRLPSMIALAVDSGSGIPTDSLANSQWSVAASFSSLQGRRWQISPIQTHIVISAVFFVVWTAFVCRFVLSARQVTELIDVLELFTEHLNIQQQGSMASTFITEDDLSPYRWWLHSSEYEALKQYILLLCNRFTVLRTFIPELTPVAEDRPNEGARFQFPISAAHRDDDSPHDEDPRPLANRRASESSTQPSLVSDANHHRSMVSLSSSQRLKTAVSYAIKPGALLVINVQDFNIIVERQAQNMSHLSKMYAELYDSVSNISKTHHGKIHYCHGDRLLASFYSKLGDTTVHASNPKSNGGFASDDRKQSLRLPTRSAALCAVELQQMLFSIGRISMAITAGTLMEGLLGSEVLRRFHVVGEPVSLAMDILRATKAMTRTGYASCFTIEPLFEFLDSVCVLEYLGVLNSSHRCSFDDGMSNVGAWSPLPQEDMEALTGSGRAVAPLVTALDDEPNSHTTAATAHLHSGPMTSPLGNDVVKPSSGTQTQTAVHMFPSTLPLLAAVSSLETASKDLLALRRGSHISSSIGSGSRNPAPTSQIEDAGSPFIDRQRIDTINELMFSHNPLEVHNAAMRLLTMGDVRGAKAVLQKIKERLSDENSHQHAMPAVVAATRRLEHMCSCVARDSGSSPLISGRSPSGVGPKAPFSSVWMFDAK